ncbi:MAG: SpoIID/LytB domain-containing protein [Firmicutes bacterium]|nr:SpoIID/LytB domain-containing protein [Bacillota bacterium]
MLKKFRVFSIFLAVVLVLTMLPLTAVAAPASNNGGIAPIRINASAPVESTDTVSQMDVIAKYVNSIKTNDWTTLIQLSSSRDYDEYVRFFADKTNNQNKVGLYAINTASLFSITKLDINTLALYDNESYYKGLYGNDLGLYLVGANINCKKESKDFYNGVNFFIVILGKENGQWKVLTFSEAPPSAIEAYVPDTSQDILTALDIVKSRNQGIFKNGEGQIIGTNRAAKPQLNAEEGHAIFSLLVVTNWNEPANIKVQITATGVISTVVFYTYCKNVLPNEWIGSWNSESLKAGAECVKMVGWYRVYNAKYPGLGYDIKDSTADQVYKPNTAQATCTAAIDAVSNVIIVDSITNLFYLAYNSGTSGSAGTQNSGVVSQYGTQYLANTKGYGYVDILKYYYGSNIHTVTSIPLK